MLLRFATLSIIAFFATTAPALTQDAVLDLIPANAGAAVGVRNLAELKKKGEEFYKAAQIQSGFRPSWLFDMAYSQLNIKGLVDENAPAAILLIHPRTIGQDHSIGLADLEKLLVGAIPYKNLDKLAGAFGYKAGELKPGSITANRRPGNIGFPKLLYVRGKHLFVGNTREALDIVVKGKSLGVDRTAARRKQLNQSDLLIHIGTELWRDFYTDFARRELERIAKSGRNAHEKKTLEQFIEALQHVRYLTGTAKIDEGIGVNVTAAFDKDNAEAKKLLAMLRLSKETSTLRALPQGEVIVAQAAKGDGAATGILARATFDETLRGLLQTNKIVSAAERPLLVGVFNEVWQHLKGSRAAMYLNRNRAELGAFSLVAVLDTADAKTFLRDMKELADIADGSGLKLNPITKKKTKVDIAKLIRDLGHPRYRLRELATLKLRLLGEPALPFLNKAVKSDDLETSVRATKLREEIVTLAAQRRKDLLSQDPFRNIRPTFAHIPKAEKRAGHSIDVLRIKLPLQDESSHKPLQQLLGPQWNNMRLAVHGNQLVVLLGSDTTLLDRTLKNLDAGQPGLAKLPLLKKYYAASNASRRFELHVSVARLLQLVDPAAAQKLLNTKSAISSVGLGVEPDRLQLDVWVPISEVRVLAKQGRW